MFSLEGVLERSMLVLQLMLMMTF